MTSEVEMDERIHDSGEAEHRMVQHASIDKVSDGPKKGLIAIIGLLITIAGLLVGVLNQTYKLGAWVATHEAAQRVALTATRDNAAAISGNAAAIKKLTESIGEIANRDTVRGTRLEVIERELRAHRRTSEQQP